MTLIVIIDDRLTNRTIYSKLAQSIGEGVAVRAFGDAGEALAWLEGTRPDLIVTDHDMPGIDGAEFISRFRALPHSRGVPIMVITVNDQRTLRLRALECGATDFLTTPIDHFEFLSRARNLLSLGGEAKVGPAAVKECGEFAEETRRLLARCGAAAPYALHVLEIDAADGAHFDASAFVADLRRRLREPDLIGRIDRLRFLVLQAEVADASEAEVCARRLRALGSGRPPRVGTALPGPEASPELRAVKCLREALARASAGKPVETREARRWRFQPQIDLRSGAVRGAQFLRDEAPAELGDAEALRAALASAAEFRAANRPLRLGLRLSLSDEETAEDAATLLSKNRVGPDWLDIQFCAREALAAPERAERAARRFRALGAGLSLDLGTLPPVGDAARAREEWGAPLGGFVGDFQPALMFSCRAPRPASLARLIRASAARRTGRAPLLVATGVSSPALLRPLRRAGVASAQGSCFGAPLAARDLKALAAAWPDDEARTTRRA